MAVILQSIINWFQRDCQSDVECYIESKNPKNAGDVEYWMQQYTQSHYHNGPFFP